MTSKFRRLMWKRFIAERDGYLDLLREVEEARAQIIKSAERIRIFRKLLALEGKYVDLPSDLENEQRLTVSRRGKV
jgi:hypothetical protein